MIDCPVYVLHYKRNSDRLAYLRGSALEALRPAFITEMDKDEFAMEDVYRYDPVEYARRVMLFKDTQIGTVIGLNNRDWSWAECIDHVRREEWTVEDVMAKCPWLRPQPLKASDVSLLLKHRLAWERIASRSGDYAIVAEDDVFLFDDSLAYLETILKNLPSDFDYIDIAGGLNLAPRGDPVVNEYFYRMVPPRARTTCCAILRTAFVRKILREDLSLVLGIDWMLTTLFQQLRANVYWVEPIVFGHGSQMNMYASNREADTPRGFSPLRWQGD
jgi:hypothetical protein